MNLREPNRPPDLLVNIQMATDFIFGLSFLMAFGSILMGILGVCGSYCVRSFLITPAPRRYR